MLKKFVSQSRCNNWGWRKEFQKGNNIKETENQIRDAFSLSLEIKSAYQVPDRINKKKITYKIHNILIQILNSEKKWENLIAFKIEGKLPLKGRENLPTMGLLICTVESEEHGNKIHGWWRKSIFCSGMLNTFSCYNYIF